MKQQTFNSEEKRVKVVTPLSFHTSLEITILPLSYFYDFNVNFNVMLYF